MSIFFLKNVWTILFPLTTNFCCFFRRHAYLEINIYFKKHCKDFIIHSLFRENKLNWMKGTILYVHKQLKWVITKWLIFNCKKNVTFSSVVICYKTTNQIWLLYLCKLVNGILPKIGHWTAFRSCFTQRTYTRSTILKKTRCVKWRTLMESKSLHDKNNVKLLIISLRDQTYHIKPFEFRLYCVWSRVRL